MAYGATERLEILRAVSEHLEAGLSVPAACRLAGVPEASVRRWRTAYETGGLQALEPRTSTGRPRVADALGADAVAEVRQLALKTGSTKLAYEIFAQSDACPEPVREAVQRDRRSSHDLPLSLRRAASITPEVKATHRGPKTADYAGLFSLRDMTELMPDGTRRAIEPGDWWEMDDMSLNTPFAYDVDPAANPDDACAQRFGKAVGRQSLWAMDVASGKWLGFELIGRPRDAYRAEDILRFCRKLFQTWGLPRRGLRLERGIWRSKRVAGVAVAPGSPTPDYEQADLPEEEKQVIVGGLASLGIEVVHAWTSKQKGLIESSFDHLQSIMAGFGDR